MEKRERERELAVERFGWGKRKGRRGGEKGELRQPFIEGEGRRQHGMGTTRTCGVQHERQVRDMGRSRMEWTRGGGMGAVVVRRAWACAGCGTSNAGCGSQGMGARVVVGLSGSQCKGIRDRQPEHGPRKDEREKEKREKENKK